MTVIVWRRLDGAPAALTLLFQHEDMKPLLLPLAGVTQDDRIVVFCNRVPQACAYFLQRNRALPAAAILSRGQDAKRRAGRRGLAR